MSVQRKPATIYLMAWTEQLPSGNWRGLYRDGNRKTRSAGTYPHERKALLMAEAKEGESRLPGWRDPRAASRKWGDWADEWWDKRNVAPGTLRRDRSHMNNHIIPKWEKTALADITRHDIKAWAATLAKDGLGESSVYRVVSVFAASLAAAVDAEILASNPAYRLKLPNGEKDVVRFFTRAQVDSFIERTDAVADRTLIGLMAGCGLRWGEANGLRRRRYDPQRHMIRVAEVWDTRTKQMRDYPKGRKVRDVPVPGWVADLMDEQTRGVGEEERVLDLPPAWWRKHVWVPLNTGGRVYDLRHTYASLLLQAGIPIAEVSRLMGHSSISITERYAHLADQPFDAVLAALK